MNERQRRFVDEYLLDLNATQAAIRAGYSEKTAKSQGQRLLTNVDVATAIEQAQEDRSDRTQITQDYVLSRLHDVAERCMQAEPVLYKNGERVMVETPDGEIAPAFTFQAAGANRALELLGKHLGMFADRHEHSGKDGGPLQIQIGKDDADL